MSAKSNPVDFPKLMTAITNRTIDFLKTEINMNITDMQKNSNEVSAVKLRDLTVLVSLIMPMNNISRSFSFDQPLINQICEIYCGELDIEEEELNDYMKETADDMINIVVGNTIPTMSNGSGPTHITPPMIISNAKSISAKKTISFFVNELSTDQGSMKIICAMSKD
jgi:CheY-specific phosphatase CheX